MTSQAPPNNPHEIARQQEDAARPLHPYDQRMRDAETARRTAAIESPAYVPVESSADSKKSEMTDAEKRFDAAILKCGKPLNVDEWLKHRFAENDAEFGSPVRLRT